MKARHRSLVKLCHNISGHGKGKWQSTRRLIRYKLQRRRRNLIAAESRRRNWSAAR